MANLPERKSASMPSLPERAVHREWIGGRAITLLSHYWRDDDPVELTAAIGQDWADVLEGLPQEVIQRACIAYQRQEPRRKPTPGAIYVLAMDFMPRPVVVRSDRPETPDEKQAYLESASRDRFDPERRAQAEAIMADVLSGMKA